MTKYLSREFNIGRERIVEPNIEIQCFLMQCMSAASKIFYIFEQQVVKQIFCKHLS